SRPNSATATTDPRVSPPRGSSPRSAGSTGRAEGPVFPGAGALKAENDPGCPAIIHLVSAGAFPTSPIIEQRFGYVKAQVRRPCERDLNTRRKVRISTGRGVSVSLRARPRTPRRGLRDLAGALGAARPHSGGCAVP